MILLARICADSRPIFPRRVMFAAFDSHGRRNEEVFFLAVDEESNLSSSLARLYVSCSHYEDPLLPSELSTFSDTPVHLKPVVLI